MDLSKDIDQPRLLWLNNIRQVNLEWLMPEMRRMMNWEVFDNGWTEEIPEHLKDLFSKTFPEK